MPNESPVKKIVREILVFNLVSEELGLDISCVREVLKVPAIHSLPKAPEFVEGVMSLRGHIIAVIDLRKKLGLAAAEENLKRLVIVCRIDRFIIGLIVDDVIGVMEFGEKEIGHLSDFVSMQIEDGCISDIVRAGKRVIVILDLERVLTKNDLLRMSNIRR